MCQHLVGIILLLFCAYPLGLSLKCVPFSQAATFSQVLETEESSDEKAIMAMGLLNTIETILSVMEEQPEITAQLQPTVLQVVGHIFMNSIIGEWTSSVFLSSLMTIVFIGVFSFV